MKGNIIYKKTIPARSPEYAEFPKSLHPDIQDFLSGQNIKSLYTHQAEAFSHAMAGENIVITTPTAVYGIQRSPFCFRTAVFRNQRPPIF